MKHYGQASSWIKLGCCYFNLVPRALQMMQSMDANSDSMSLVDVFLQESGFQAGETDLQQLIADAMDTDRNYAVQNKLRRGKVVDAMTGSAFGQHAMVIDALIKPVERGINFLLGHTQILHDLWFWGRGHPKSQELRQAAKEKFVHVLSGGLADKLMSMYVDFLRTGLLETVRMGLIPERSMLNKIFQLATVCITDIHRRFKYDFSLPPYSLFRLLDLDTEHFVVEWSKLLEQYNHCERCFDPDLSGPLLRMFGDIESKDMAGQDQIRERVQGVLEDMSQFSPLTSDCVELKNGQTQWSVSRRASSNVKNPKVAAETTLIQSAVKQHCWVQDQVAEQTLPPKSVSSGIQKMVGVSSQKDSLSCCGRRAHLKEMYESVNMSVTVCM